MKTQVYDAFGLAKVPGSTDWSNYINNALGGVNTARPACYVYGPTPTTVAGTGADTPITAWASESFDTDGMHSASTNTDRITCVTPGVYDVKAGIRLATPTVATQAYATLIHRNSAGTLISQYAESTKMPAAAWTYDVEITVCRTIQMAAGDYITMTAAQGSGGALAVGTGQDRSFMSAAWTGGTGAAWGNAGAKVSRAAAMSVPNGSWTDVTFDTVLRSSGMTAAASTSPLTCVTPGEYSVSAASAFTAAAGGTARIHRVVHKNSSGTVLGYVALSNRPNGGSSNQDSTSSDLIVMAVGDFLQVQVYQDSGAALNTSTGSGTYSLVIAASRVGYSTSSGSGGGVSYTVSPVKTAAYSPVTPGEIVRCDTTAGAFTVTLPATHAVGNVYIVKDVSGTADTNSITVDPADADTIDGLATFVINVEKAAVQFISDGTDWMVA